MVYSTKVFIVIKIDDIESRGQEEKFSIVRSHVDVVVIVIVVVVVVLAISEQYSVFHKQYHSPIIRIIAIHVQQQKQSE